MQVVENIFKKYQKLIEKKYRKLVFIISGLFLYICKL